MGERRAKNSHRRRADDVSLRQREARRGQTRMPYPEEQRNTLPQDTTYVDPKRIQQGRRMARRRAEQKRKRRRNILLVIVLILLLAGTYAVAKIWVAMDKWEGKAEKSDFAVSAEKPQEIEEETEEKTVINAAILGTDEDGFRTDVNIIVSFDTETGDLHMISVPRDTRVTMTADMIAHQEKTGGHVPQRNGVYGQCKLTEIHAFAGKDNRCAFTVAMLEDILDIELDYYVKIDLSAFRKIVDAVDGVDFYVPQDMYWDMTDTGGPLINLKEGMQHLDGNKAEQLVRFRDGYAQKDLKRIQVQQDFIKALIEKICSSDTLMRNLNDLIGVVLDCTESNITISEALGYVRYMKSFDPAKITNETIPGVGGSYFDMDEEGTKELIDWRIRGIEPAETVQTTEEGQTVTGENNE